MQKNYSLRDKTRAFLRGFKSFHPLVEVAREGLSGRYALSEKQGKAYGERVARFHLDLHNPNRAEVERVVDDFSGFPPEVQKAVLKHLLDNMENLESAVIGAFCGFPGGSFGSYKLWTKTRERVLDLIDENGHMLENR